MVSSEAGQANVELTMRGLEKWIAGDHEAAIATFTEDIEVLVPTDLGNAGSYRGIEQFRTWFANWDDAWSEFKMSVESIEAVGSRHVIAMIRSRGIGAGSGIEVENFIAWVFGVRDGMMDFLSLQPDLEAAKQVVSEREGAAP